MFIWYLAESIICVLSNAEVMIGVHLDCTVSRAACGTDSDNHERSVVSIPTHTVQYMYVIKNE